MKKKLDTVTLIGIDCVDIKRLVLVSEICQQNIEFAAVKLLSSIESKHGDVVPIRDIKSREDYSRFVISQLDNYVSTSHVLNNSI